MLTVAELLISALQGRQVAHGFVLLHLAIASLWLHLILGVLLEVVEHLLLIVVLRVASLVVGTCRVQSLVVDLSHRVFKRRISLLLLLGLVRITFLFLTILTILSWVVVQKTFPFEKVFSPLLLFWTNFSLL